MAAVYALQRHQRLCLAKLSLTEARTVQRNLKQLVKAGLVQVGRVPGIRSNAFSIVEEAIQAIAIEGISFAKNQLAAVINKGDICAPMGDISSAKGDIFPAKGDASVTLTEGTDVGTEKKNGGGTDARAPAPVPAPAPATPAAPSPCPSPAFFASPEIQNQTAVNSETADAPATPAECSVFATLVDRINVQRAANGEKPFALKNLKELREEAAKAGMSPVQVAEWILESPKRNFFLAKWFENKSSAPAAPAAPTAPATPAVPVQPPAPPVKPLSPEEQAQVAAAAVAAREQARQLVEQMRASKGAGAQTAHEALIDTANLAGPKWAVEIVKDFAAGMRVNHYPLETACTVLNINAKALRAQQKARVVQPA